MSISYIKRYLNLSQTMNFVAEWVNAKSIAKIGYKIHGPRQI